MRLLPNIFLVLMFKSTSVALQIPRGNNRKNPSDPGRCKKPAVGKLVTVKDRQNEDKVLVCVRDRYGFRWKMTEGNSYGNYFDPANHCSDIVDNVPDAKNGVYWIKTEGGPRKAWCDVVTDGGGFMLIGVQNSSRTMDVPSDPSLVKPNDERHWSSAFGGKKVLDFRIQIATSKRSADTKAHWYYRLKSTRKLTQLLRLNAGGCSNLYPGVGDVKFVKDLRNSQVVTTHFECSRFDGHFHPNLGWAKMNKCFGVPCKEGFAHFKLATTGSFSFSVESSKSGILDASTAFIGCLQNKCCACFGPSSDKNYCSKSGCKPINGGTVLQETDAIHATFWIRTTLPKRIWKKCMEYEIKSSGGKMEKWHVDEGVSTKGPCSNPGDVRLNDGVAVVGNNRALGTLPKVEGLLSYRGDNRHLYFRGKSHWKSLATSLEVLKSKKDTMAELRREIKESRRKEAILFQKLEKLEKKLAVHTSCQAALKAKRSARNGVYRIRTNTPIVHTNLYCRMTSLPGCSGGGWTLVMKINGQKETFHYSSTYWSDKSSYNLNGGLSGLDDMETKLPTYWSTSFNELCVGMKVGNDLKFVSFRYPASSLYDLIADGKYRSTNLGRQKWKSLISGSSLQNSCNKEGFNVVGTATRHTRARLGIIGNNENECHSTDSFIGFGGLAKRHRGYCDSKHFTNSCGNSATCSSDNGDREIKAMGYIFVR